MNTRAEGKTHSAVLSQGLVHKNLLHSIAGSWVVDLRVNADLASHVNVTVRINVDVADAVGMTQDGNLGVLLDVGHQCIAASWDD